MVVIKCPFYSNPKYLSYHVIFKNLFNVKYKRTGEKGPFAKYALYFWFKNYFYTKYTMDHNKQCHEFLRSYPTILLSVLVTSVLSFLGILLPNIVCGLLLQITVRTITNHNILLGHLPYPQILLFQF